MTSEQLVAPHLFFQLSTDLMSHPRRWLGHHTSSVYVPPILRGTHDTQRCSKKETGHRTRWISYQNFRMTRIGSAVASCAQIEFTSSFHGSKFCNCRSHKVKANQRHGSAIAEFNTIEASPSSCYHFTPTLLATPYQVAPRIFYSQESDCTSTVQQSRLDRGNPARMISYVQMSRPFDEGLTTRPPTPIGTSPPLSSRSFNSAGPR